MAIGVAEIDCAVAGIELVAGAEAERLELLVPPLLRARLEAALAGRLDDAAGCDELLGPALDAEEFPPAADDPAELSATATPYPVENSAAPTPRATANPPTRPTKREAPMIVYLPDQRPLCLCGG
ncbi:hypothetical protein MSAR_12670 [Mycolicibacterium sarraceniae]|uniref:Uncharacterized protein n=1 Tax=Mycolicibacterium sarraceniae TaxID=1534348 RepID=A0A7I7SP19_9MYCO|nr:hypothetical protein MSAR_12670 [Mycolicibacterium sarraceniae]